LKKELIIKASSVRSRIVVAGSANVDYVVQMERFPSPGETLLGEPLQLFPGGKGANQAVAAAMLARGTNTEVCFIGNVGNDDAGTRLVKSLSDAGIRGDGIRTVPDLATGTAMIWRDSRGNNCIVVSPAANFYWSAERLASLEALVHGAALVLLQMEIPLEANQRVLDAARAEKAFCIVDPAPARRLPEEFLRDVDLLTPNEVEACTLLEEPFHILEQDQLPAVAEALLDMGPRAVLLKLGERGSFYKDRNQEIFESAHRVHAIDTTAAGDVFNGAFSVAFSIGSSIREAMRFASTAAAISVTRAGAQSSIPTRSEILSLGNLESKV